MTHDEYADEIQDQVDPLAADKAAHQSSSGRYSHSQRGWVHAILESVAIVLLVGYWFVPGNQRNLMITIVSSAGMLFVVSLLIRTLTVEEQEDALIVRFGPLPLFRRRMRWEAIVSAEPGQIPKIMGVANYNWVPFFGFVISISGWDCVVVTLVSGARILVGTDDVDGLLEVVQRRMGTSGNAF